MSTDADVIALVELKMNEAKGELIRDFCDFIDYCIEWEIAGPTKEDFDKWLHGDRRSIFNDSKPTDSQTK